MQAAYQNADRILMSSDHQHDAELAQLHISLSEKETTITDLVQLTDKLTAQLNAYGDEVSVAWSTSMLLSLYYKEFKRGWS